MELYRDQIKTYATQINHCRFDQGYILESRFGRIIFDFSSLNPSEIILCCKKISGNGKIQIIQNRVVSNFLITSKNSQNIILSNFPIIEIIRGDGIGEVNILGFIIERKSNMGNWNNIVKSLGNHKGIRLLGDRLFATETGFFEYGDKITYIETLPANVCLKEHGKIRFLTDCEIVKLEVIGGDTTQEPLYQHIENTNFASNFSMPTNPLNPIKTVLPQTFHTPLPKQQHMNPIIYDSSLQLGFDSTRINKQSKIVKSNGKDWLIIKKGGLYQVPISSLNSNTQYVVVITVKNLNGNGRIRSWFSTGPLGMPDVNTEAIISENNFQDKYFSLNTGDGDNFKLNFGLLDDSSGEVLVSRIRIITGINLENVKSRTINNNWDLAYINSDMPKGKKRFVIVIPSYNNAAWCEENIKSAINQNYDNYRVIFIDDCSSDNTFEKVEVLVNSSNKSNKFSLIKNTIRLGALHNLYNAIHSCDDEEIILTLDGDDWLANEGVLQRLNEVYYDGNIWMTYGQYKNYPDQATGIAQSIPDSVIASNTYRKYKWCSTHLRSFYTWLFKSINKQDFLYNGEFMIAAWDMTIMFPMLEMSGKHARFIDNILYVYNMNNPISDHRVKLKQQQELDRYVRAMPSYQRLTSPLLKKESIGLLLIATGKYDRFVQDLITSADKYFLNGLEVTYYIFSDKDIKINTERAVVHIPIEHRPFPYATLDRYKHFTNNADTLSKEQYLFYVDVDCLFTAPVSIEVLGNLTNVLHCGYVGLPGPVENKPSSVFYIADIGRYKHYFGGGYQGGKSKSYLELCKWCYEMIEKDSANGVMALWHDETAMNRYLLDHEPDVILDPGYHYPSSGLNRYKKIWGGRDFDCKIKLLDKDHEQVRN